MLCPCLHAAATPPWVQGPSLCNAARLHAPAVLLPQAKGQVLPLH